MFFSILEINKLLLGKKARSWNISIQIHGNLIMDMIELLIKLILRESMSDY